MSEASLTTFGDRLRQVEPLPFVSELARERGRKVPAPAAQVARIERLSLLLSSNDDACLSLRLSSCGIDDALLELLCRGLRSNSHLQRLLLHGNSISDRGVTELCRAIETHESLLTLWLGANRVSDEGMRCVLSMLWKNRSLQELNVSNRWPERSWTDRELARHPHISAAIAPVLASYFRCDTGGLVALNLSQQRLLSEGAALVFEAIHCCQLRSLNLRDNCIDDSCCAALSSCLQTNFQLHSLDLSHNGFTDEGASLIAEGLAVNSALLALALDHNLIGSKGLDALFQGVMANASLETLTTYHNLADDARAETWVAMRARSRNDNALRNAHSLHHPGLLLPPHDTSTNEIDHVEAQVFDFVRDEFVEQSKAESEAMQVLPIVEVGGRKTPARALRAKHMLSDSSPHRRNGADINLNSRPLRPSSKLGHTPGVPYLGIAGAVPVRSSVSEHVDSGTHLFYMRVSSPLDRPLQPPYPLLKVILCIFV